MCTLGPRNFTDRVSIVLNLVIVRLPTPSKWQNVHSHYHSANLVLLFLIFLSTLSPLIIDVVQALTLSAPVFRNLELADLPWLKEVHKKIWNQKGLRPELFRKVEATQADYTALQKRLKEFHPDRDSPDYDSNKRDVLSIKLDFLRSLTPAEALSPRLFDDIDDRVDDHDPEIKPLLPSLLSFLDLSTLELKEKVPERLPLPLLLREEYKDISELIKNEPQNNGGSVIISGQPGTGECLVSLSHTI